jgi:hypothetical protein
MIGEEANITLSEVELQDILAVSCHNAHVIRMKSGTPSRIFFAISIFLSLALQ